MAVCRFPVVFRVALVGILSPVAARPQANISADEIPIERCDVLPVVELRIDASEKQSRAEKEQEAADELVREFESALEAADEATLAAAPLNQRT